MADPAVWGFLLTALLMAALAYAATRLAGRLTQPGGSGRNLRVLEALPLGRDRGLYLVQIGTTRVVIGVTPGGVSVVHTPGPLGPDDGLLPPVAPAALAIPFGQWRERWRRLPGLRRPDRADHEDRE